jgi:DNA-binding transcriptional MerR regulator
MKIGEVAKSAGIGIDAIRFYERRGLIDEPARSPAGYRDYPRDVVTNLRFIARAKDLGFSLKEILELLTLERRETASAVEVKAIADRRLADIEERIRAMQRMRRALRKALDGCPGRGPIGDCSILQTLVSEGG